MVKITFFKRDGVYYGFRETGHAEFEDAGKDIVGAGTRDRKRGGLRGGIGNDNACHKRDRSLLCF